MVYIGAHVSAAGGTYNSIGNAREIGAEAIQIFGSSPRQWKVRELPREEVERFRDEVQSSKMGPVFFHAPYLINLAAPSAELRKKSEKLLQENLRNATQLAIKGVIFHVGSRKDVPWESAKKYVASALKRILKAVPGKTVLAIENSAGGGNTVGSTLEEIQELIKMVNSKRLVMCLDTAHAFESGILTQYTPQTVKELVRRIDELIGWNRVVAIHLNDSKTKALSHHDRHENIGEGFIGIEGIRAFVRNKDVQKIPWYLEVPGFDGQGPDQKNIKIVKKLLK